MHELSIALEVCRIAEERLGREGCAAVREVAVEVGDDAGVEPENLAFCLEAVLADPPFGRARPVILRRPGDALHVAYLEVDDGGPDDRGP
ncbi:MAG: hydrogenase maturation nickel metallochaperone HypA [Gemmatimonadales bacterium]|jgi:Zn finger protein HypA/HybF involved in hydrogenase expression|nr:hydrogenase maturation nickel metallochaperone HypA [Gemmatimonadales bacterium]